MEIKKSLKQGEVMFRNAKTNDRVFDYILQEWGNVVRFNHLSVYPIEVKFSDCEKAYTVLGKQKILDELPVLFWDEVKPITPPKKSLPKLEIDTPVLVWNSNDDDIKFKRYFSHFDLNGNINCFEWGATNWSRNGDTTTWTNWELAE